MGWSVVTYEAVAKLLDTAVSTGANTVDWHIESGGDFGVARFWIVQEHSEKCLATIW
jgi:hypothetical protein